MAYKRALENIQDFDSCKVSKLCVENDCDKMLDSTVISDGFKSSLEYDSVLKSFSILMEKERKDGYRFICFGVNELQNIIKILPTIEKLAQRYSSKRPPTVLDVPFQACSGIAGDLVTVISLKENTYKRGQYDVDIRKCVKKEEDSYQFTSEGVRFAHSLTSKLIEILLNYQSTISHAMKQTKEAISLVMASKIIRQIEELSDPRLHCYGCKIDHPSQKEHLGPNGCLSVEPRTWEDLTFQHWLTARNLIEENDAVSIASQAASQIPEIKNVFLLGAISPNDILDNDLKDLVIRKDETEQTDLFKILLSM